MTPLTPKSKVYIQNDSGAEIPPHSVVVVTSVELVAATSTNEAYAIHHVDKYSAQKGNILVTGPTRIRSGSTGTGGWSSAKSFGYAYSDALIYAAIDESADIPVVGEQWGPVSGQWYVSRKGAGFFALGHPSADITNGFNIKRSMFRRDAPAHRIGKLASSMGAGTLASPQSTTVDIWEDNAVTTHTELLALAAKNPWNIDGDPPLAVRLAFEERVWRVVGVDCP